MEHPFYRSPRSPWNPVRHDYFPLEKPRSSKPKVLHDYLHQEPRSSKPKVVSIPVHFMGSEEKTAAATSEKSRSITPTEPDRTVTAIKIQKVLRGFLVRKNVRMVRKVAEEVDEIERRIRAEEDLIRRDAKERLRVNEMLMALLLRLDSVRGVRDYRKKVIRRVISLQEELDSIAAAWDGKERGDRVPAHSLETAESIDVPPGDAQAQESEDRNLAACDASDRTPSTQEFVGRVKEEATAGEEGSLVVPMEDSANSFALDAEEAKAIADEAAVVTKSMEESAENEDRMVSHGSPTEGTTEITNCLGEEAPENIDRVVGGGDPINETLQIANCNGAEESKGSLVEETLDMPESSGHFVEGVSGTQERVQDVVASENAGMKEVMERVAEESDKLKGLVAELCERSAQQCQLMGALAERVEHLERVVEKMERMKKKKKRDGSSCALNNKCGRKKQ